MLKDMNIVVDDPAVTKRLGEVVERDDKLDLVLSMIPGQFGTSDLATYLGFRAVGLDRLSAFEVLGTKDPNTTYESWLVECPELEFFENHGLRELQARVGPDIMRLQFNRNMVMFAMLDHKMLRKAHRDWNSMSDSERDYLRTARRHYTPKMMTDMEVALEPEKHRAQTIVMSFGNQPMFKVVEGEDETVTHEEYPLRGLSPGE